MLKKIVLWSLGIITLLFVLLALYLILVVKISSVDIDKEKSIEITGVVDSLYEGGVNDLVFKLKDNSNIYYINRGLENGFYLLEIQENLLSKEITLWHTKARASSGGHIIQFRHKDSIYYSEWEIPLVSKN